MIVSAPGKLILAGEYAVLRGGVAVVAAVARRARASTALPREPSPFLDAAADALRAAGLDGAAALLPSIGVDTSALRARDGTKLGLGSSAAATVAALGAALTLASLPLDRDLIHSLARTAHHAAQGALGSGADIAAATYGGLLKVRGTLCVAHCAWHIVRGTSWMPVWTGQAADTRALVRAIEASGANEDAAITEAAERLIAGEVIEAIGMGADAIERLQAASGVPLVPDNVRAGRAIARGAGGEMKTCGAGGGDVAIAVFPEGTETGALARAFEGVGLTPLDMPFDPRGVDIDAGGDYLR